MSLTRRASEEKMRLTERTRWHGSFEQKAEPQSDEGHKEAAKRYQNQRVISGSPFLSPFVCFVVSYASRSQLETSANISAMTSSSGGSSTLTSAMA